jgi:hypothetical protein
MIRQELLEGLGLRDIGEPGEVAPEAGDRNLNLRQRGRDDRQH